MPSLLLLVALSANALLFLISVPTLALLALRYYQTRVALVLPLLALVAMSIYASVHFSLAYTSSKKAIEDLRSCGFENIGLDLIYGLEGQTLKGWIKTLKQAMGFEPEHLSCYQLAIEKRTPFGRLYERGLLMPPGEEKERNFFLATSHFLKERGYIHYEISNFAKNASLVSRHNCKYWFHVPYLGLGPSAHSFHNSTRRWNTRSLKKYCEMLENGNIPVEGYENLTEDQLDLERISLGLRTRQGFDAQKLPDNPALKGALSSLRDSGFLKITNNRIVPTGKGFLVADSLPLYFL